jgi:hypothetical protein
MDFFTCPLPHEYHFATHRTMGRCVEAAEKDGLVFTPFTRHDMKAKGVSDAVEGQNSAGHKSQQMQALYRRKLEQVEPPK